MPNDRDVHFLGFADLLASEIEALDDLTIPGTDHLYLSYGHWKERVRQIIAQRAYDLSCHVVEMLNGYDLEYETGHHSYAEIVSRISDLTQWPESPTER